MPNASARLLFIPVSGPRGMGEYARCLAIATALAGRRDELDMHFLLSRAAPYAATTPFATTLLDSSPTFHPREVREVIRAYRPGVVVFDNAGRTTQLAAARAAGARIVFVSSRLRQRRRGFRLRWMRLIDEHWIAYPQFIAGAPGPLERLKLNALGRPRIRFIDALLPPPDAALAAATLARFALTPGAYVLVVPGGGSAHPGAERAPATVAAAAAAIATHGHPTLLVGADVERGADAQPAQLRRAPRLPLAELVELMRAARLVVANGGDTLLQVLACERPCVAVAIAHDQAQRIASCVRAGLAAGAALEAPAIERTAVALLGDAARLAGLEMRLAAHPVPNRMEEVLAALLALAG